MNLIIAFSTTNEKKLIEKHFGDADSYQIYEISKTDSKFLKTVINTTEEEDDDGHIHGDPQKAKSITEIVEKYGVQVLCGKQFGQNIVRMVKRFLPVVVSVDTIEEAISLIHKNFEKIEEQWKKGENRKHLRI